MKLTSFSTGGDVITSGDFQQFGEFGIDSEGLIVVASILRDKLYQDKILAPIREYISNAWDAHAMSNKKHVPLVITIPTAIDPVFKVRDFGPGLSESEVADLYTKYGKSTKRNSNKSIGSFGIGCKSGFCVSDNFLVTSFYEGTKNIYNCYLDERGNGIYVLMSSETTTEENGVEITIPVKSKEIHLWQQKISNFIQYINPKPTILNGSLVPTSNVDLQVLLEDDNWILYQKRGWDTAKHVLIMGIVPYAIEFDKLDCTDSVLRNFSNYCNIQIKVPIGTVDPAANRESLEYTDKTKAYIINKLRSILKKAGEKLEQEFNSVESLWKAKELYYNYNCDDSYKLFNLLKSSNCQFKWKDIIIDSYSFKNKNYYQTDNVLYIYKLYHYNDYKINLNTNNNVIECRKNTIIILDDLGLMQLSDRKLPKDYIDRLGDFVCNKNPNKDILLVRWCGTDAQLIEKQQKEFLWEHIPHIKLSDLPIVKDWRPKNITPRTPVAEHVKLSVLKFVGADFGKNWEKADIDLKNGAGYYVVIDRFQFTIGNKGGQTYNEKNLIEFIEIAKHLGFTENVYGFKQRLNNNGKIGKNWIEFTDHVIQLIADKYKQDNISQLILDKKSIDTDFGYEDCYSKIILLFPKLNADHDLMKQFGDFHNNTVAKFKNLKISYFESFITKYNLQNAINNLLTAQPNIVQRDIRKELNNYFEKNYKLAHILFKETRSYHTPSDPCLNEIVNYIKLIDSLPKTV